MANEYYWKVWLRPNLLTKDDDNDYVAEVLTQKDTLHNENIANAIIKEGSEIKYDTLLSIIKQRDRIVREHLMMGYSLLTEVCQYTPRITGPWGGETAKFDPAIHKLTLDIVPSAEMRDALSKVGVEVLGAKSEVGRIGMVTDTFTGLSNGSITPNEDILIEGDRIRINGADSSVGIFFVSEDGEKVTPVTRRLTQNDPQPYHRPRTGLDRRQVQATHRDAVLERRHLAQVSPHDRVQAAAHRGCRGRRLRESG